MKGPWRVRVEVTVFIPSLPILLLPEIAATEVVLDAITEAGWKYEGLTSRVEREDGRP